MSDTHDQAPSGATGRTGTKPTVSIGLPVFNGENYVGECIEAILSQTYSDFELIIADNASTDSTLSICEDFACRDSRIRILYSNVNRGAAWNYNRTFHTAEGKYFKWAAHDDVHASEFVERCIEPLESNDDVVLCFPRFRFVGHDGGDLGDYEFPVDTETASKCDLFRLYAGGGHIVQEIFGLFRSAALRGTPLIGPYVGSDLILLGRLALAGRFVQVPEVLFYHREHDERSAVASESNQAFTAWYDSRKSGRFAMPRWRRVFESARSVFAYPMPLRERFQCLYDVARTAYWNRLYLYDDLVEALFRRGA